jgi:hypothetical protein
MLGHAVQLDVLYLNLVYNVQFILHGVKDKLHKVMTHLDVIALKERIFLK